MVELQSKIDKKIVAELPKVSFPGRIFVIYTEAEARKAIDYLNTHVLVGVDTETRPSFRKGAVNKVALLQVSTYDTCFLFRLNHLGLPDFLEEFLQNDVLKIGLSLKDDFAMLRRRTQKDPRMGNWGGNCRTTWPLSASKKRACRKSMPSSFRKRFPRASAFPTGRPTP